MSILRHTGSSSAIKTRSFAVEMVELTVALSLVAIDMVEANGNGCVASNLFSSCSKIGSGCLSGNIAWIDDRIGTPVVEAPTIPSPKPAAAYRGCPPTCNGGSDIALVRDRSAPGPRDTNEFCCNDSEPPFVIIRLPWLTSPTPTLPICRNEM